MRIRRNTPKPWHTPEYLAYLDSEEWTKRRAEALARAGHRCEKKWTVHRVVKEWTDAEGRSFVDTEEQVECCSETTSLEVHHRSYDRLGHEEPQDLMVLCQRHHGIADRNRHENALYEARLNGWATKVYGEDWEDQGYENVADKFDQWRYDRQ